MKYERPWGSYEVLYDKCDCKVKKIIVKPMERLSYQYHKKRNENWVIVSGFGNITIDDKASIVKQGDSIYIPALCKHTIENTNNDEMLIFIEVQTGTYFGEDDIVRINDKYGRI